MDIIQLSGVTLAIWLIGKVGAHTKCIPWNEENLHEMWEEGVRAEGEHASIYLLPAYLSVLTARNQHHGRWGCFGGTDSHEATNCRVRNLEDSPTSCKAHVDINTSHPIDVTSDCPWHYQNNMNKYRYPRRLVEAHCNPCGSCYDNNLTHCVTVNYTIPVLLADPGPYDNPKHPCNYFFTSQHVPVGCTCALKSKPVVPRDPTKSKQEQIQNINEGENKNSKIDNKKEISKGKKSVDDKLKDGDSQGSMDNTMDNKVDGQDGVRKSSKQAKADNEKGKKPKSKQVGAGKKNRGNKEKPKGKKKSKNQRRRKNKKTKSNRNAV